MKWLHISQWRIKIRQGKENATKQMTPSKKIPVLLFGLRVVYFGVKKMLSFSIVW